MHGQGTSTFARGARYVGKWINNRRQGYGILTTPHSEDEMGAIYMGGFMSGTMHGYGELTWRDGGKYIGGFKYGLLNGDGIATWTNGRKYEGEFKNALIHGKGILTDADGSIDSGFFLNGDYIPDVCEDIGLIKATDLFKKCVTRLRDYVLSLIHI